MDVTLPNGSTEKRRTSLCCEAVCFFSIKGVTAVLNSINHVLPRHLQGDLKGDIHQDDDSITFILARYFSPHPSAYERDAQYRPVCPGPLRLNHCLWKYAESARYRRSMCHPDGSPNVDFVRQGHLFGDTATQRRKSFDNDKRAYFNVIVPRSIQRRVHMTREFIGNTLELSDTWLETVTLI